jgi:cell division septum initiation protein DivIVA
VSSVESAQPGPDDTPAAPRLTSIPVDPLASHIATMIRRLDDEVVQLREQAQAEAERVINEAHGKAARIVERATEQAREAEERRDAMLEERARVTSELRVIRDTIVGLAGRFEQERPDIGARTRSRTASGQLPPPPRRHRVDENQQPLWAEPGAAAADEAAASAPQDPSEPD